MVTIVPESPRFYMANRQFKKAFGVYHYLAKLHPSEDVRKEIVKQEAKITQGLIMDEEK